MNKKGQKGVLGFALIVLLFVFIITSFALIDPFKEFLDTARDSDSLNCKGTDGFNQTDFDDDTELQRLTKRPTCFITGIGMIWFIGAFIVSAFVWLGRNWGRLK